MFLDRDEDEENEQMDEEDDGDDDDDESSSDDDEDYVSNKKNKKSPRSNTKATKTPSKKSKSSSSHNLFQNNTPIPQSSIIKATHATNTITPFRSTKKKRNTNMKVIMTKHNTNPKTIQNALLLLATKLSNLESNNKSSKCKERLRQSLFASLLNSHRSKNKKKTKSKNDTESRSVVVQSYHENDLYYTQPVTKYTSNLTQIAFDLVQEFNKTNNPTTMQVKLLNLLFLSVGGTTNSMLLEESEVDAEEEDDLKKKSVDNDDDDDNDEDMKDVNGKETKKDENDDDEPGQIVGDLEELDGEDWSEIITNLVEDMRSTPTECIPFSSDPYGALHWSSMQALMMNNTNGSRSDGTDADKQVALTVSERDVTVKKGNSSLLLAAKEYRAIYEEFWYVLGTVALVEGGMSINNNEDDEKDVINEDNGDETDEEDDDDDDGDDDETSGTNKRKRKSASFKSKKKAKTGKKKTTKQKQTNSSSTTRFDTEIVNGVLSRLTELVTYGQPDVRAAATTAALYMLHAIVDKTAFVQERLEVTNRQYAAAVASNKKRKNAGGASGAKAAALKHQIDALKRTCDDLEHIIESCFVKTIFMHRYRDSNMYIRASCLQALGRMAIVRPDFFLMDRYLKYFGWMLSDKAECVRIAALSGLLLPFQSHELKQYKKFADKIDLMSMERVLNKFLPRIVDCVIDIHESVQEQGMKLLLALMRNGFLDEPEDKDEDEEDLMSEEMWDQVNLMALESNTTASVRKDALYFIMEQLEDFDDGDDERDELDDFDDESPKKKKKKKRGALSSHVSDRKIAQRLDAIASWAAHTLTAGKVPIEKIRIRLVNHLVYSLRAMSEHKAIVTNWSAMVRAITDDNVAMTSQGTSAGEKADVAKQRVLVQMLICAAQAEVGSVNANFLNTDIDPDIIHSLEEKMSSEVLESTSPTKKGNKASSNLQHESLSIALIKTLPNLLVQFRSDPAIIESLVNLPRYFIPSVFSLPQRKSDFVSLTKNLTEIFLQSNDEKVLVNAALSLTFLCKGDHARAVEAKSAMKKMIGELRDRTLLHLSLDTDDQNKDNKAREGTWAWNQKNDGTKFIDKNYSLYFNLKRIGVLSKRLDLSDYIENNEDDSSEEIEKFCNFISDGLVHRLTSFKAKVVESKNGDDDNFDANDNQLWKEDDKKMLQISALVVHEGLQFLLSTVAWKVRSMQEDNGLMVEGNELLRSIDEEATSESRSVDHVCIRLKNRLITLVELCFEQHLPEVEENDNYSDAQVEWSNSMQEVGGQIASDLRSLFLKEWSNASSPLLRAAAITEDSRLIAGYIRYFQTKEAGIFESGEKARHLLLPLVRGFASNWKLGNRREASHAFRHITGSGSTASDMVDAVSRLLKKIEPVRLLEAQMASLRLAYEDWLNNDPEDIMGDNLTQGTDDVTMNEFKELERKRDEQFKNLQNQAQKFSSSLGVRKLSDDKLSPGLLGFMQEGIRFSFSGDDDLLLGCRLSFLKILSKYAHWIKRDKSHLWKLAEFLHEKEIELKKQETEEKENAGEDFEGIHEDDLEALASFRSSLGLKESTLFHADDSNESASIFDSKTPDSSHFDRSNGFDDESRDLLSDMSGKLPSSTKARRSRESVGSALSKMSSTRGSLSPLYEEAGDGEDDDGESPLHTERKEIDEGSLLTPAISSFSGGTGTDGGTKSTGLRSELTNDSESTTTLTRSVEKTQSTFDGEQSDNDVSESKSETLESPH